VAAPARSRISLTQQAIRLQTLYPHLERPVLHGGRLRWAIPLQPTPISTTYKVAVDFKEHKPPRLFVVDPHLVTRPAEDLPHTFTDDGSLCLHYGEFSSAHDHIADVLVPWASEWLLHYELWLATGEWHGGGIEHRWGSKRDT
jgi:hypothetical protein